MDSPLARILFTAAYLLMSTLTPKTREYYYRDRAKRF